MKRTLTLLLALLLTASTLLTACTGRPKNPDDSEKSAYDQASSPDSKICAEFDAFLDDLFLNEISLDTISLHFTVMDPSIYHLEDMSPCWTAPENADRYPTETIAARLAGFDPAKLTDDRRLTYEILSGYCRYAEQLSAEEYAYFSTYLDMNNGVHTAIPVNLAEYEFYREKDVTDFLSLIEQLPGYMDEIIAWESERVEAGFGAKDAVLDEIIEKCDEILNDEEFYLIPVFAERIDAADFLSGEKKAEYKAREKTLIETEFMQAFRNLKSALESFRGKAKNTKGLAGLPHGAEYYQLYVDYITGTDYTCQEMIKKLDDDYASIYRQLYAVLLTNSDAFERFEEGNLITLQDPAEILDYLRPRMAEYFPAIEGDRYEIRYLPKSMEKVMDGVLAYYTIPQVDNFLTGRITINGGAGEDSDFFNTVAHEGYPGHMYQTIYFYSQNPANIRKMLSCNGYSEGWAYYAADFAYSLYDFGKDSKAMATLLRLDNNLSWNISCRLDIAINYEGWTVEQVAAYMDENGLVSDYAQELFDSMIGSPGVYLTYYMGYLEFMELQNLAKTELGDAYSPLEFHKAVLSTGSCPFPYVKEAVEAYIKEAKK